MGRTRKSIIMGAAVAIPLTLASSAMAATVATTTHDNYTVKQHTSLNATSTTETQSTKRTHRKRHTKPVTFSHVPRIIGTVISVNGNTVQVTGRNSVTYTTDASSAVIRKGFGTNTKPLTVSQLTVGSHVAVVGDKDTPKGVTSFTAERITLLK